MPASDSSSHDPAFGEQQVEQSARIIDAVRKINATIVRLSGSLGSLVSVADWVEALLESLDSVTHCEFSNCYASAPDTVQGGMIAAVYDQPLASAVMAGGRTGPTLWLKMSYRKSTPINQRLRFECAVESIDGEKVSVTGICQCGDEKLSEAQALMLAAYPLEVTGGGERA